MRPNALIVADSTPVRRVIKSAMAGWRAKFTSAPTEPLAAYDCHRPDFVVMDIQTSG